MPDAAHAGAPLPWPARGRTVRWLLVLTAGGTNAFGFLALNGVFTSVVTANSALLGLHLGSAHLAAARAVAVALLGYVVGASAGSLVSAGRGRIPSGGIRAGLLLESALLWLVAAGWLWRHGAPTHGGHALLLFLTAAAMGCQNASVRVTAGGDVTTAYLTGLLTSAIVGWTTAGRLRARDMATVLLLIAGAAAGGVLHRWLSWSTPLLPALLVTAALAVTWVPSHSLTPLSSNT
ncbi:YoaK family protein [Streptomyces sp. S.PB5]|uniref:YoaK family protein n=1 Tax=Streptomyces sp. S.PB5 TaxID=3020844 RepID=UPI0025B0274F|nr:YoaK family protein [Streptomyces sp. S.PB5]MDN3028553.1 YoaK family protein [Streptomyces sp. S.PB5]